jgi:uncharacterized membrane protein (UPF0127 family)
MNLRSALLLLLALAALAFAPGCDETTSRDVQAAKIGGKTFFLEIVDDNAKRMKGMGGRTEIAPDGGMLFVFPTVQDNRNGGFVMRDCPIDIDIIYLDAGARVITMHEMKAEAPRGEGEGQPGELNNSTYENRLKRYPSRYPYQFAIELKGGTLPTLKVREGDKIDIPVEKLKARAK